MSNFNIEFPCGTTVPLDFTCYPDGTENLIADKAKIVSLLSLTPEPVVVNWQFEDCGRDLFRACLISNFLFYNAECNFSSEIKLKVDYLPNARADRLFPGYVANPLKACLEIFENLVFDELIMDDVHNLKNVEKESYLDVLNIIEPKGFLAVPNAVYIAPDKGAKSRVKENLKILDCPVVRENQFLMIDKVREGKEVKQIFPEGYELIVKDKTCFIIDDICDGGRTFIGLGEKLKAAGAAKVTLVVTHGLFSQGLEVFKGKIDYIWTKNVIGKLTHQDILKFNQELLTC